ncbi:MAG: class I SAM-dependent methyltransferase [Saprospiraceae bacterium]
MDTTLLNERIRHFYDQSTRIWLDTWGEHMHHGYYGADGSLKKNHQQAQVDLIEELLRWGGVKNASNILDAGCGVGGSARYLAKRFGANVLGLTLSPVQAEQGVRFTKKAKLESRVKIVARDLMSLSPADGPFDLIWSLESAEHIEDKKRLLEMFYDLLTPGGQFLMATWCHRNEPPALNTPENALLEKLYELYHLPPMVSIKHFEQMAVETGFREVQSGDWSEAVAPFWNAVIRSAISWRSVAGLLRSGLGTMKGAWAMRYMTRGYRMGTIKFGVLQGKKL